MIETATQTETYEEMIIRTDALWERMKRETGSLPNQLAVVGWLKHERIVQHVKDNKDALAVLKIARTEVLRDVHIDTMEAAFRFLIYTNDWQSE